MPVRTVENWVDVPGGGTRVHDRVTFEPRVPLPGLASVLERVIDAFFRHRQRRLRDHFASGTVRG